MGEICVGGSVDTDAKAAAIADAETAESGDGLEVEKGEDELPEGEEEEVRSSLQLFIEPSVDGTLLPPAPQWLM